MQLKSMLGVFGVLLFIFWAGGINVRAQDPRNALPILSQSKDITDAVTPNVLPAGQEIRWVWRYDHDSATKFLRLHIKVQGCPNDTSWFLLIKDGDGNVYDRLTASSLRWAANSTDCSVETDRWTQRVPGQKVRVELHAIANPRNLRIVIDRLNYSFFMPGTKAITTGSDNMRDLVDAFGRDHRFYSYGRSVAIIYLQMSDGSGRETNCTGFLLAPDLLMTNRHCISESWQLDTAKAVFGFESKPFQLDTVAFTKIEMQDEPLDFTILRLAQPASSNWPPVKISNNAVQTNGQLLLIQHPSERTKVISQIDCTVQSATVTDRPQNPDDFYHLCDCEGGSSGAPIIEAATGRVIGLHHLGIERPRKSGINLAVKMDTIMRKVATSCPALHSYIKQFIQ